MFLGRKRHFIIKEPDIADARARIASRGTLSRRSTRLCVRGIAWSRRVNSERRSVRLREWAALSRQLDHSPAELTASLGDRDAWAAAEQPPTPGRKGRRLTPPTN